MRRWPGGIYALWYPVKDRQAVADFREGVLALGLPKVLDIRLDIRAASQPPRLDGTGMIVVNPPFTLAGELAVILPALVPLLAEGPGAGFAVESLGTEASDA